MEKIKTQNITWYRIDGSNKPDADTQVLVYCRSLDDVVFGYLGIDVLTITPDEQVWLNAQTGYQIMDPVWWAETPFPENDE